jgi:hypothetical protein|tara:strand:+ start:352 stop:609 length:258 start_codon:yes stop_codon:yes gene_type:complete
MKKFNVEITETIVSSKIVTLDVPDDWTEGDIKNKLTGHSLDMSPEGVEKEYGVKVYDPYPNDWQNKDLDIMGRGLIGIGEVHERT